MYTAITDRELKKASNFELYKDYYVKNGNGNWYVGKLKNLNEHHYIDTVDGKKKVYGMCIDSYVGIHPKESIYELNLDNLLKLPPFPSFFIFGGKEIKTEDLTPTEINLIVERWKQQSKTQK